MENVIRFPHATKDGGKARIRARKDVLGLTGARPTVVVADELHDGIPRFQVDDDSLVMLRAVDTSPCEMVQDSGDWA